MFSRKRRRPTPSPRKPFVRPRLEELENRLAPASAAFNPLTGSLSITGAAGAAVQVASTADGGLAVTVNGRLLSAAGAGASTLHAITSDGATTLSGLVASGPLSVSAPSLTIDGAVDAASLSLTSTGLIDVDGGGSLAAGSITISADSFVNTGQVSADGGQGGTVSVTTADYLNGGVVESTSPGSAGAGGVVTVDFTDSYIDVAAAVTEADGAGGAGGQVTIDGGATGQLFSSGTFGAVGTTGGDIGLFGNSVALVAATADASGTAGAGGQIRVGGDYHGDNPDVPNAQTVDVSGATVLRADGGGAGAGGRITVWSESETTFDGSLLAKPAGGGAGGFLEASSHGQLTYGGAADAGVGGTLLLDPQFLTVAAGAPFSQYALVNPAASGTFGTSVLVLANGNIVVTDPNVSNLQGSVYLFNGQTGALISTLKGGTPGDGFAPTLTALPDGNFVIAAPTWDGGLGAVTWASGTNGVTGVVNATTSLIGSLTTDNVGSSVTVLPTNGNFVVNDPTWGNNTGAVVWGNAASGVRGRITASNALVGSTPGDSVGSSGVTTLPNGNFVVDSPKWNGQVGAVTWVSGASGLTGAVSATNSLTGANAGDDVGLDTNGTTVTNNGITVLTGPDANDFVVASANWNGGEGAVTWVNGANGHNGTGVVGNGNSLVGSHPNDFVGLYGVTALTNGNYVVDSPNWNGNIGAVTWSNRNGSTTGTVSGPMGGFRGGPGNSIVGSNAGDLVGGIGPAASLKSGVVALSNGNFVVASSNWNGTLGAITWGNGNTGTTGTISAGGFGGGGNSLIGKNTGDELGFGGITPLASGGDYVIDSPNWNTGEGAITWEAGGSAVTGTFTGANSLTGTTPDSGGLINGDHVGSGGVFALGGTNNYVVDSPAWNGTLGAVTWENGSAAITAAAVGAANSLVGATAGDEVGSVPNTSTSKPIAVLSNGDYLVFSYSFGGGEGAVTLGTGAGGVAGVVSALNSLVGSTPDVGGSGGDHVGFDVLNNLTDFLYLGGTDFVIGSPNWNSATGAVTEAQTETTLTGVVSAANSLVGDNTGDEVGEGGLVELTDGDYVVLSPAWNANVGAATWMNAAAPDSSWANVSTTTTSLFGSTAGDLVGSGGVVQLANSIYLVVSPSWNKDTGAVTWVNGATAAAGVTYDGTQKIDAANSLEGTAQESSPSILALPGPSTVNTSFLAAFPVEHAISVGFTDPNQLTYALAEGESVTVSPTFLTNTLDAGTSVTLQANDDVTIDSPITETGATPGSLTLDAGRSIILNASITTNGQAAAWAAQTSGTARQLNGVWGTAPTDVFAVGANGTILHSADDGAVWTAQTSGTGQALNGVWGSGNTNIFAVGANGTILQSVNDGGVWSPLTSGINTALYAVWGTGQNDIFAVGAGGVILHSNNDGSSWSAQTSGVATALDGVWGTSSADIFAVGAGGVILFSNNDGATWTQQTSPVNTALDGVWGTSSTDVFAVGAGGVILHYNGTAWSTQTSTVLTTLTGVFGSSSNDVFAVGAGGVILHSNNDGATWTPQTSGTAQNLAGVWESGPNDVFAVEGAAGTILHYSTSGNLTLVANDSAADGVVNADRDPGAAAITEKLGVTLNTGSGILSIDLKNGTDKTNNAQRVVTLLNATAVSTTLSAATQLGVTIDGTTPLDGVAAGTYTQSVVTGPLSLNSSTLVVSKLPSTPAPVGTVYTIIEASGGVVGTFAGLPEGSTVFASDGTPLTISYMGNGTNDDVTLTVAGTTSTVVTSSANPATFGTNITFTTTVTNNSATGVAPSGTVKMSDTVQTSNGPVTTPLGAASFVSSGVNNSGFPISTYTFTTTTPLSLGTHTIQAVFTPTAGNALIGSTGSVNEKVGFTTTTTVTSDNNPSTNGESVIFTASVTSHGSGGATPPAPTGNVVFLDNGVQVGEGTPGPSGGATATWQITLPLPFGPHNITAEYMPSGAQIASSGVTTEMVNGAPSVTALKTDGTLLQSDGDGVFLVLSPAGTILADSNVIDGLGRDTIYAITTSGRNLWEFSVNQGWTEISPGSFRQISAASNSFGDPVVFGVLTDGSLWENSSAFNGWRMLSAPGTIASISAVTDNSGNDVVFAITTNGPNNLWEHSLAACPTAAGWICRPGTSSRSAPAATPPARPSSTACWPTSRCGSTTPPSALPPASCSSCRKRAVFSASPRAGRTRSSPSPCPATTCGRTRSWAAGPRHRQAPSRRSAPRRRRAATTTFSAS